MIKEMIADDQSWGDTLSEKPLIEARARLSNTNMAAVKLYLKQECQKKNTWINLPLENLMARLKFHTMQSEAYLHNGEKDKGHEHLLHTINYAKMIAARINES